MHNYRKTFVSPADGELPRLQPLARLEPVTPLDVDAAQAFARPGVQTHESRDPLSEAWAFTVKYAALSLILLVLAIGLTLRLEWHYTLGIILFATMASTAYWVLALSENWFTGPGVERHRLTIGGRVLTRQIDADERVRLAQIRLQRRHLEAQREYNAHITQRAIERAQAQNVYNFTQIQSPRKPQERRNGSAATRMPFDVSALEPPRFAQPEPARAALLDAVIALYARGDDGQWRHMDPDGYIFNSVPLPWAKRGGYTQAERRAMLELLHRSRLACFDEERRAWRVSVRLFPDAQDAIDAIGAVATGVNG